MQKLKGPFAFFYLFFFKGRECRGGKKPGLKLLGVFLFGWFGWLFTYLRNIRIIQFGL